MSHFVSVRVASYYPVAWSSLVVLFCLASKDMCRVMSYCIISSVCHVMSCRIMSYHLTSGGLVWCHVLHHLTSGIVRCQCHIVLFLFVLCYLIGVLCCVISFLVSSLWGWCHVIYHVVSYRLVSCGVLSSHLSEVMQCGVLVQCGIVVSHFL